MRGSSRPARSAFSPYPGGVDPGAVTTGPDGNLYFAETSPGAQLGRITTQGVITSIPVPTSGAVTAGLDGNIWVTGDGKIAQFVLDGKPANPNLNQFAVPSASETTGITKGPNGNLFFTETDADGTGEVVGRITPAGQVTEFISSFGFDAGAAITTGPDGNLWLSDPDQGAILRMTPAGVLTEFAVPSGGAIGGITSGPDGDLWFTESSFIGRITTKGVVTEFPLPTKDSSPAAITAGPDGNLYFAETSPAAGIGRITTSGVITEIPIPPSGGITAGPMATSG